LRKKVAACFNLSSFAALSKNVNYFRNFFVTKSESFREKRKRKLFVSTIVLYRYEIIFECPPLPLLNYSSYVMRTISLRKFIKFLILIRFLPLVRSGPDSGQPFWRLNLRCPRFLLLMAAFLAADAAYLYYMFSQHVGVRGVGSLTALLFKLTMMTVPTLVPLTLGLTACRLGGHACRAVLSSPGLPGGRRHDHFPQMWQI
jgi:hypothetical protein